LRVGENVTANATAQSETRIARIVTNAAESIGVN